MILAKKINNTFQEIVKLSTSDHVMLLGIIKDNKLTFKTDIETIVKNANLKLHALKWIRKHLSTNKAEILCNAFINSQFNYAPIIWMS